MNQKKRLDRNSSVTRQVVAAVIALIVVAGASIAFLLLMASAFPTEKSMVVVAFFLAPIIGLLTGRLCYQAIAGQNIGFAIEGIANSDSCVKRSRSVGTAGFAIQLIAYLSLCIVLGSDTHIVARQFRNTLWVGFNICVAVSMLTSSASVFWIYSDAGNWITYTTCSLVLFAIMYFSFLYAATWLADPFTIPDKLAW